MFKVFALFFCLILCTDTVFAAPPEVEARAAVLMDMDSGRILWSKNAAEPLSMASTTKIMTALIALERGDINDIVTVSRNAALAPPVKMHLSKGEEVRLYDLLLAMMLQSYNDSAVAVAEHICGSTEEFCRAMNLRAAEMGCTDTYFETPNGLDKGNHHSTAADMALIARCAMQNEEFVRLVNTPAASFKTSKGFYSFANKDRLLREYDGALGIKTGFTNKAGQCFAGAAKRGSEGYITVVLASGWGSKGRERKWVDTKHLLDYGFENYEQRRIITEGQAAGNISVTGGKTDSVPLVSRDFADVLVGKTEEVSYKTELPQYISAPVKKGCRVGTLKAYIGGELVAQSAVITADSADKKQLADYIKDIFNNFVSICAGSVL